MIDWTKPLEEQMPDPFGRDLTEMSEDELVAEGQNALAHHMMEKARLARERYGPLSMQNIYSVLKDPDLLRHPVRLVFEYGEISFHQFAQPAPDPRDPSNGFCIYLRPCLKEMTKEVPFAVAYMIPVINYGEEMVTDELCLQFGASLLDMSEEDYYTALCTLAEEVGADEKYNDTRCGCGSGCSCG